MPLPTFRGDTFIAFADISGFKKMLEKSSEEAIAALGKFYQAAYGILSNTNHHAPVYGLLISDCAVLYVNTHNVKLGDALEALLAVVKQLNEQSLEHGLMLTTSIAFGPFHYEQRLEFTGIEKNLLTGSAYVEAYKDTLLKTPRLRCGDCRIVAKNLPQEAFDAFRGKQEPVFSMTRQTKPEHYYFYWMRNRPEEIEPYEAAISDVENLKFQAIRLLLSGSNALKIRSRRD